MIQTILILLFSHPVGAQAQGQQNSIQICAADMAKIYEQIKPDCTWEQLPETHPRSYNCAVSCAHNDPVLASTDKPIAQPNDTTAFPFRLEEVSCGAGVDACNKDSKSCIEAQKKDDLESCKHLSLEEKWHRDPSDPPPK